MAARDVVQAPDLPELERHGLPSAQTDGELVLLGALIERDTPEPVHARRVRIRESELASFALAGLQNVVFERVNLAEASFMEARMQAVQFIDCTLTGTDFRGARLSRCAIRGSSLEDVLGVESLSGLQMPWSDLVASAGALAAALGIDVEAG